LLSVDKIMPSVEPVELNHTVWDTKNTTTTTTFW